MSLKLYGHLVSQPTRAVAWVLKIKGIDYELVQYNPRSGLTDEFLKLNPNGLVPVLQDGEFTLFEGAAILTYLSEKFGWTDLLPTDIHQRAKVNQYLHWHHTNARKGTTQILVSYAFNFHKAATPEHLETIAKKDEIIDKFTGIFEKFFVGPFIVGTEQPTIADFFAYTEYDQLDPMGVVDLSKYPKLEAWIARMKALPFHDELHKDVNAFLESFDLKPVKPATINNS